MTKIEYFKYSLANKLYNKITWFYTFFAILNKDQENEYMVFKDGAITLKINNELISLDGNYNNIPVYKMSDKLIVNKNDISNLTGELETYIGRILVNKIMIVDIVGDKIPFIDKPIKTNLIENNIGKLLSEDKITVKEYIRFVDTCSYMHGLSRITTVSATYKNVLPPKGIDEFKKNLIKEFNGKYGENWITDRTKIVEFETKLKEFDTEYLKGDPSFGKLVSGKVKDSARTKMYLTFGAEVGFDKKSGKTKLVNNSLLEGYPKDKELLTNMYDTVRSGSYDRGKETQKGGSAAKDILRATSSIKIVDNDCNTKLGKIFIVTNENHKHLINRYIILNGKSTLVKDDSKTYIGKTVILRSPQYCKSKNNTLCSICVGDSMKDYKTGIPLLVTDISSILLYTSMAAMHFKAIENLDFRIEDVIK